MTGTAKPAKMWDFLHRKHPESRGAWPLWPSWGSGFSFGAREREGTGGVQLVYDEQASNELGFADLSGIELGDQPPPPQARQKGRLLRRELAHQQQQRRRGGDELRQQQ